MVIYLTTPFGADPCLRRMRLLPGVIHPAAFATGLTARRAFLLFCLAPRGVYLASFIAVGAVGSYPAISPLPFFALTSYEGRFLFCDTFHCPELPQNLRRLRAARCLMVSGLSSRPRLAEAKPTSDHSSRPILILDRFKKIPTENFLLQASSDQSSVENNTTLKLTSLHCGILY